MLPLILFYMGSHPDHQGRYLSEILAQNDLWLEVTHDYIQWLFPNKMPSRASPNAPLLTTEATKLFCSDDILQSHLQASLARILRFYGLCLDGTKLVLADNWDTRKANWFIEDTHNNLRITGILYCLTACGFQEPAKCIHTGLLELKQTQPDCGIGKTAFEFWKKAI